MSHELSLSALYADGTPCPFFELELNEGGATATCTAAEPLEAGIRVELALAPTDDPRWLVPGVFYGENRVKAGTRIYPRFTPGHVDVERMESDAWSFRADRCATPAVFAAAGALVTTEESPLGQSGVGFAYVDGRPLLRLHFPYREEPLRYDGTEAPAPPDVRTYRWSPGERIQVAFTVHESDDRVAILRGVLRPFEDPGWVDFEQAAELAAWGLYRWHYRADPPRLMETAAFDLAAHGERDNMHVSWVSGAPYAYALLRHGLRVGNDAYVDAGSAVLDHIAANLTPGGTFWAQWTSEKGWTTGWHPDRTRLHARTLADAALFLLRAARLTGRAEWAAAVDSNLDVACQTQREDGAFPDAHRVETGEAVSWDGTAGMAWIPALVEAGRIEEARRAGEYYTRFDAWHGAPEDVDLAPTSEDGYAAVMAFVTLEDWETARRAADWMLTFRYTYDVAFSPQTFLGAYGFRTRGADQASPVNQHLHNFGLVCLPEMVRLARATGDVHYLETTRENLACFRQFIAREDGDFNAYRGMVAERYFQTDYIEAKGMLGMLSHAWCIGVLLDACEHALELGL
ncbi:MAG: hypothetical protein JWM06_936 [Actinomycetia bacterium]|nr:hypothetical protein [Actinomycetes bacterium]